MEKVRPISSAKQKREDMKGTPDYLLIGIIIGIVAFGVVMVYSASFNYCTNEGWAPTKLAFKQLILGAAGIGIMIFVGLKFDYHIFVRRNIIKFLYGGSIIFAASVRVFGLELNGAKRCIQIGPIQIQPSEFVKVTVILMLASYIMRNRNNIHQWRVVVKGWLIALVPAGVVAVIGSNLSSGLVILGIGAVMMFSCSGQLKVYLCAAIIGVVGVVGVIHLAHITPKGEDPNIPIVDKVLSGYRLDRIRVWEDPWIDPSDNGYQPIQSLLAVGSGGLFGVGLGSGVQKLGFVPEPYNDIIFAIICEELGLVGALTLMFVYMCLLLRGMRIALKARDYSGTLIAIGVSSMIGIQALINVAVNTNTLPTTGMQLPLISYGGTALVVLLGTLGLLINVSRNMEG